MNHQTSEFCNNAHALPKLSLYTALDRVGLRNYRAKIMVVAFVGTHIPLIALLAYVAAQSSSGWADFFWTLGVTLVATLAGTGITLFVLHHLLEPLSLTSRALRRFKADRILTPLPMGFTDEAGTLMSDAAETMTSLDHAIDLLENLDEVTGLPNRRRMIAMIEKHLSSGDPFAVAVIRFSDYGRIAETLDLEHAHEAARVLAERLRVVANPNGSRSDVVVGALSGSEFSLLLADVADTQMVTETLLRIIRKAGDEMTISTIHFTPTLGIGAALYPDDATGAAALLDCATAAAAQARPASPVVLHSPTARADALERFRLEQDLSTALARNELELHYQPVVDLGAGRVVGSEALVRWRHPDHGMVPPGVFIPVAEASGQIDEIGEWILWEACTQLHTWTTAGRDLSVAVNLSGRQLADHNLRQRISEIVDTSGIDPSRLEVELTETAAMTDHDHSRKVFTALRDMGIGIAIDDFGTGYASLSTLRSLPFTKLKIDREFVTNIHQKPASQAICEALLALSRGLDLRVLAEGTETAEEVMFLAERNCVLFQGFHFARPMPTADFELTLAGIDASLGASSTVAA